MSKNNNLFVSALKSLREEIISNKYPLHSKLPCETELSKKLNIGRSTLRKVLDALKEEGLIESIKGSGSFICNKNIIRYIPIIISHNDANYRKTEILKGIQDSLNQNGFSPLLTFYDSEPKKEIELVLKSVQEGHKNLIIYPLSSESNVSFYQRMIRKGINIVFVDTLPNTITCDYVTSCNFLGGYNATRKLIELGHKEIAFCSLFDPNVTNTICERYNGYLSALDQHKLNFSNDMLFIRNEMSNDEFINHIITNLSSTAIFASSDELAVLLNNKLSSLNKTLPAIIGFDNSLIAESINLASINQDFYEIGKTSAELLYKRILNPTKNFEHIYIPVSLIERSSLRKNNKL